MKEVSSCQENIDMEAISGRSVKKEIKSWIRCSTKWAFCWRKVPSYHENLTWKQPESIPNYTELIAKPIGPFAFIFNDIVWTALFDKRSLPWRCVAEASLVNHERFPGRDVLKSALLNGQTWFARSGTRVAELGSPASLKKKKKKKKKKTHAVIGHQNFAAAVKKL